MDSTGKARSTLELQKMEMPEGWERLYQYNHDLSNGREKIIDQCLDFIAEMAEALEVEERAYLHANMLGNPVTPILKKFKEWK